MNKFIIITPVYNAEKYIKKCIDSVKSQTYQNWEQIIISDCSTDNTKKIIEENIKGDKRFHCISNGKRLGIMGNTIKCIDSINIKDEDIIVMLDGDDWLSSPHVLDYLDIIYQKDIWVTWGQFKLASNGAICRRWAKDIKGKFTRKNMKEFCFSHLKTFKYFLYKKIRDKDLRDTNNKYYSTGAGGYFIVPIVEMAGEKHRKCVDKVLYCYNNLNPLNVNKLHEKLTIEEFDSYLKKEPYEELK